LNTFTGIAQTYDGTDSLDEGFVWTMPGRDISEYASITTTSILYIDGAYL